MKHVVWINMSGKTVLVFGGMFLMWYPGLNDQSRVVGTLNFVGMLLGQLWYTSYWTIGKDEGVDSFVEDTRGSHPLTDWPFRVGSGTYTLCWILAASMYYVAFCVGFAVVSQNEAHDAASTYELACAVWHGWVCIGLWWAALMQACGRKRHTGSSYEYLA